MSEPNYKYSTNTMSIGTTVSAEAELECSLISHMNELNKVEKSLKFSQNTNLLTRMYELQDYISPGAPAPN